MSTSISSPMGGGGGGNAIPKANKVPSTDITLNRLFYQSASATVPEITSPRATTMVETYREMKNLKAVPAIHCPKATNFAGLFLGDTGITDASPFVFLENMNYDSIFEASGVTSIHFANTFKSQSSYQWAFKNCKSLRNVTDSGLKDNFTILGSRHRDCFWGATNLILPLSYTNDMWIQFPQSTDIAGCLRATNAFGSYSGKRGLYRVDAPYAKYANAFFWDASIETRPQRYYSGLTLGIQRCDLADGFFGAVKVESNIYMEYLPNPGNNPDSNNEIILGNVEIVPGTTAINILRNTSITNPPMYEKVSRGIINAMNYYGNNVWSRIRFDNCTVSIATISAIQNSTYVAPNRSVIEFNYCTFEDPEGLYTLQTPAHAIKLVTKLSTNLNILERALTTQHTLLKSMEGG